MPARAVVPLLLLGGAAAAPSWEAYKRQYGKSYPHPAEDARRRGIFESSLRAYAELNAREPLARYGPTRFSDREHGEYARGGFKAPSAEEAAGVPVHIPSVPASAVPAKKDWSAGFVSPIKDQNSCGGCWAESVIEQIESDAMIQHNWTGILSTQQLIDCTKDGQGSWRNGCGGGNPIPGYKVLQALGGVASGYDYKFIVRDAPCATDNYTKYVKVDSYATIAPKDEEGMKAYVGTTGPLSVCVDANDWGGYTGGIKTSCGNSIDHCVQLVGYGSENGVEYWKLRNSWGSSFGEDGYIRLAFGKNLCGLANGPTATNTTAIANTPVPHRAGCTDTKNWADSYGETCLDFELNSYCSPDAQEGPGWNSCTDGDITGYTNPDGLTALQGCCACGGGSKPVPPGPAPLPPPYSKGCTDHPKDWRSSEGDACCVYAWNSYCTPQGKPGRGWESDWGPISDYAGKGGISALDACCACGGGQRKGA